ncbi:MAG: hypothetical protein E2576_14460 [Alcaligenaceae bacterium]|nr:hypothetical protein [Alcaligenaceae bacterium SAGV5]MPS50417.1 hypothetical protein [Alcaligenaceae bacterium SAGV3]MPT57922.1 hypothetical protein [Alcaligenaceae bacterium]
MDGIDGPSKFNWWALGIGLEAAFLALAPMALLAPLLVIAAIAATTAMLSVGVMVGSEAGVDDEDLRLALLAVLAIVATTWSLIQYWILAVATSKRNPYRFGLGFWLAAVSTMTLMATLGKVGLFGLPAVLGAIHFIAIQVRWRQREARA